MFKNKEGKVRSGWIIAAVSGAFLVATTVITMITGMIVGGIIVAQGEFDMQTLQYSDKGKQMLESVGLIGMFLQDIVLIITVLIAWKVIMKHPLSNMGLTSLKKNSKDFLVGLLFGIVSMAIVFGIIVVTKNGTVESWKPTFSSDTIIYLALFILVGFAEEIYSRGFMMATLKRTRSIALIIIIPSILFALLHGSNPGISKMALVNLALIGILFTFMYLKSGNIWMPIGYHITWNYFQGNVFGLPVSGMETQGLITTTYDKFNIFNGGKFGPEGGIIVTGIILLGFLFVAWFYRKNKYDFLATEPVGPVESPIQVTYPTESTHMDINSNIIVDQNIQVTYPLEDEKNS